MRVVVGRYIDILDNIEGRVQRYYYKREPRQLIPQLIPNDSLNSIVRSQDRCGSALFCIQSDIFSNPLQNVPSLSCSSQ